MTCNFLPKLWHTCLNYLANLVFSLFSVSFCFYCTDTAARGTQVPVFPEEGLFPYLGDCRQGQELVHTSCFPEDTPLDSLALAASGACVHGFSRTLPNKEKVLGWQSLWGSGQRGWTDAPIFQSFPERCLFAHLTSCCLRVQLSISLHLDAAWSSVMRHCQVLVHPQWLGAIKNEVGCLHYHRGWETNQNEGTETDRE